MSAPGPILVTLATGRQGTAVIKALLALPSPPSLILAVTRSATSPGAQKLAALSQERIKLVEGTTDDVPALFKAAATAAGPQGVWGIYLVQLPQGLGNDNEKEQGTAVVDAALAAGVKHFVYSSIDRGGDEKSWQNRTSVPHFATKHDVELYLRDRATAQSGMTWTVLRPVAFMENLEPGMQTRVFLAALKATFPSPKKTLQWVATSDIGVFAAKAFENSSEYNGKAIGIASEDLTLEQLAQKFKNATGKPLTPTFSLLGSILNSAMKELGAMVHWFAKEGYGVDIAKAKQIHPGMVGFEQWIAKDSKFKAKARG